MIDIIYSLYVVLLSQVFCVIRIFSLRTILLESDLLFFYLFILGRKGGHKGRMRTYTSPDEIDAQMKAEKERKKVSCITNSHRNMKNIKKRG